MPGLNASTYYYQPKVPRVLRDQAEAELRDKIEYVQSECFCCGPRTVKAQFWRHYGLVVNRKRLLRVMRARDLFRQIKQWFIATTDSNHEYLPLVPGRRVKQWLGDSMKLLKLACLLILSLGLTDSVQAVSRVFYDNFEDGTTNKWSQDDFRNKCTVVTSSADGIAGPYAGAHMLRCNWNGTVAGNDAASFETLTIGEVPYINEVFYRVRLRVDNNTDRTAGSPLKLIRIFYWDGNQSTYTDIFEDVDTQSGLSNRGDGVVIAYSYWGDNPEDHSSSTSEWHKVEYYFNHSTNKVRVWHDGLLVRDDDTASFGLRRWYPFYITSNWADAHDATNYVYFDDVEIYSDSGNDSSITGSMANGDIQVGGTPLAPPGAPRKFRLAP